MTRSPVEVVVTADPAAQATRASEQPRHHGFPPNSYDLKRPRAGERRRRIGP